jgi:hypothetical protein
MQAEKAGKETGFDLSPCHHRLRPRDYWDGRQRRDSVLHDQGKRSGHRGHRSRKTDETDLQGDLGDLYHGRDVWYCRRLGGSSMARPANPGCDRDLLHNGGYLRDQTDGPPDPCPLQKDEDRSSSGLRVPGNHDPRCDGDSDLFGDIDPVSQIPSLIEGLFSKKSKCGCQYESKMKDNGLATKTLRLQDYDIIFSFHCFND